MEQLAAEAAAQWGMITAAQALRTNLTRKTLARATTAHRLEHTDTRAVYRFAGTPQDATLDHLRSNWLALHPEAFLYERHKQLRTTDSFDDAVVSHLSAAHHIHGLGNRQPDTVDFTVPDSRRSRDHTLRFHVAASKPRWHIVDGLPVTTVAQTIADLYADDLDRGHLGEILYDALLRRRDSLHTIAEALDHVTGGCGRDTAIALLDSIHAPAEIITAADLFDTLTARR